MTVTTMTTEPILLRLPLRRPTPTWGATEKIAVRQERRWKVGLVAGNEENGPKRRVWRRLGLM
jgi:hypothetical protein